MDDLLYVQKELVRSTCTVGILVCTVLTSVSGRGRIVLEHLVRAIRRDWQPPRSAGASTRSACTLLGRVQDLYREALSCLSKSP